MGLRDSRSPVVAMGDEEGTVQISYEITEAAFSVYSPGEQCALRRVAIDRSFDINATANELLADLGT